jgi:hypothetical protein
MLKNEFGNEISEIFIDPFIISLLYEFHDHKIFRNRDNIYNDEETNFKCKTSDMLNEKELLKILFRMYYDPRLDSDLDKIHENLVCLLIYTQKEMEEDDYMFYDELEARYRIFMAYYNYYDFKLNGESEVLQLS